jgi:hypothetical protein
MNIGHAFPGLFQAEQHTQQSSDRVHNDHFNLFKAK